MQVYAVTLTKHSQEIAGIIRDHFPSNHYEVNENQILVRTESMDAPQLSRLLGMGDESEHPMSGVVFRLAPHYYGFWHRELWEWLSDAFEKSHV